LWEGVFWFLFYVTPDRSAHAFSARSRVRGARDTKAVHRSDQCDQVASAIAIGSDLGFGLHEFA
jgi:hypothetical protein